MAPTPGADATGLALYTVGYSHHEPEVFLALLCRHGVTAIADVRSSPYSRRLPHYARQPLKGLLRQHGIAYVYLGHELGGRPGDPALYHPEGWADYERMRRTPAFATGLERVKTGMGRYTIALMCGEEDPLDCHRGMMITPALVEIGIVPWHIRRDRLETNSEFEQRVVEASGIGPLFGMDEAYRVLNAKRGYRPTHPADAEG